MKYIFNILKVTVLTTSLFISSCENTNENTPGFYEAGEANDFTEILDFKKDKAKYNLNQKVNFSVNKIEPNTTIRYKYLGEVINEEALSSTTWTWMPPSEDYRGYMVELVTKNDNKETIVGTIGIDVSSDWTKFPRYGFLSDFNVDASQRISVLNNLKDFHINGLQYYDWHSKHHIPLPMDNNGNPESSWSDLFNRPIDYHTVEGYINEGHDLNISSMFYNLLFGAWHPEEGDGFSNKWLIYNDQFHNNVNKHQLGDFGDILVTNPANDNWQDYIFQKTSDVYDNLEFDGWHLDQLGDRGTVYDYNGYKVDLKKSFNDFMVALIQKFPNKKHALNAVDQFGQNNILSTPVDFAYSEVWSRVQFADLAQVIIENNKMSNHQLNTVLAAYMNYDSSEGSFNTPSVLMSDAVIFAFGGDHLELGEHMLSKEYFPYSNLSMEEELEFSLKEYYDFMVAYENLLRDGGDFITTEVSSKDIGVNMWPPVFGKASLITKQLDNKQVVQLLNYNGASTLDWRDNTKSQTKPNIATNFNLEIKSNNSISKVWFASPDFNGGASQELEFTMKNDHINVIVPYLEYWSMIVLEY